MADYQITDTTLTAIADTIRKKEESVAGIDPAEYADRINLMGMLEEKTVSNANCVSFSDGADDVPIKSIVATIDSYYSGATNTKFTRTGKNLAYISGRDTTNGYQNNSFVELWTGQSQYKNGWYSSEYVPCPENTIMTLSGIDNSAYTDAEMYISLGFYTSTKQFISGVAYIGQSYNWPPTPVPMPFTFTTPRETCYVRFSVHPDFENTLMFETGSSASQYEQPLQALVYDINLGAGGHRAGAVCDLLNGEGDESGVPFTFSPMPETCTLSGYNNIFCWFCETAVVYRSSGTIQPAPPPVVPTLITKTITENGTYEAEDEDADGYSEVTVNVFTGDGGEPVTLVETEIATDENRTGTLTFTADYHDYPLLKVRTYHPTNQDYEDIITTPQFIDDAFAYSGNKANFNRMNTNLYAYYGAGQNNTWVRGGYRTIIVTSVFGLTSSSHEIEIENIYRFQAITANNRDVSFQKSIFDFQYLVIGMCDGDATETEPSIPIVPVGNSGINSAAKYGVATAYATIRTIVCTDKRVRDFATVNKYGFFTIDGLRFMKT